MDCQSLQSAARSSWMVTPRSPSPLDQGELGDSSVEEFQIGEVCSVAQSQALQNTV